jgi:hypothetical protein
VNLSLSVKQHNLFQKDNYLFLLTIKFVKLSNSPSKTQMKITFTLLIIILTATTFFTFTEGKNFGVKFGNRQPGISSEQKGDGLTDQELSFIRAKVIEVAKLVGPHTE